MTTHETPGFNARLWFRFIAIARPYWLSTERWPAWGLFALLIVLPKFLFKRTTGYELQNIWWLSVQQEYRAGGGLLQSGQVHLCDLPAWRNDERPLRNRRLEP